jgi:hypothetical protein
MQLDEILNKIANNARNSRTREGRELSARWYKESAQRVSVAKRALTNLRRINRGIDMRKKGAKDRVAKHEIETVRLTEVMRKHTLLLLTVCKELEVWNSKRTSDRVPTPWADAA